MTFSHPPLGVVGIGTLGVTIAQLGLDTGREVVLLVRPGPGTVERGDAAVARSIARELRIGRVDAAGAESMARRTRVTSDPAALAPCDIVIEAVPEDLELKRAMIATIEASVDRDCLIASSSSSLPAQLIGADARHPDRIVVAHYVWPANRMPLVEVATPPGVSTAHVQRLHALLRAQGKRWVKVSDTPGFLITRVLLGYWSETVEVVAEGVSPADVDGRLEAQGWPMGPCRVMDGTTLASVVRISGPLVGVLDGRIAGVRRLAPVVAAGYVGGQHDGFYRRTTPGAPTPNEPALALLREHRHPAAAPADVVDRIVGAMLNEAAYCIADGVVTSWSDVAYAIDNAFGFPAAVGGLLGYLDAVTPDGLADRLDAWSDRHGRRFTPCPVFRHRAITPVEVHS